MATLWELLEESARRFGPKTALKIKRGYQTDEWSYQRLRDFSEGVAAHLRGLGIGKGERVLVYAPNMPEWVGLYFGCLRAGIILVPLDIRSSHDFMRGVNERTDARCVFVSRSVAEDLPELGIPVRYLEDLPREVEDIDAPSLPYPEEDDIAVIMFTSGTTGRPKGVVLTHRNIASNVEDATQIIPSESKYRLLSLLPLSHMLEQTAGMLAPLKGGAAIIYPTSWQPRILFQTLREERITTIAMVPQVLQLFWNGIEREVSKQGKEGIWGRMLSLARYLPMRGRRLLFRSVHNQLGGSMEFFMCGGAYLDPELARNWELLGIPVLQGYGTTEASPIIAASSMRDREPDSVGKPLPGQEVRTAPDGEILIRGANVASGYWNDPEATEAAFEDGWYRTGDLGYLDKMGRLHLHGRKKDMIVLDNGMNVHPQDLEETLKQSEDVADACVVGLAGRGGRVRVHAALLLRDSAGDPDAIVQQANRRLSEHQRIHEYTVWPFKDFPRTHTLKVKKHEVVAYLTSGTTPEDSDGGGSSSNPRGNPGISDVHFIVASVAELPLENIRSEMSLEDDLGLDSLRRVELLSAIEAETGVYLDETLVTGETTVGELEALATQPGNAAQRPKYWNWPLNGTAGIARSVLQSTLVFPIQRLVMPEKSKDTDNLKDLEGPVIFAANHLSHLDTPAVIAALPRRWRRRTAVAAAADVWFDRGRFQAALSALLFNAFPFFRTGPIRPSLERCSYLLSQGWSVLIYPEGGRSTDGRMMSFKAGAGLMAIELGVPVVPVYIEGTYDVLPKDQAIPRRGRVIVRFGEPLRFSRDTSYADAARAVEDAVRNLGGSTEAVVNPPTVVPLP